MATQAVAFNAGGQTLDDIHQLQCNILEDIADGEMHGYTGDESDPNWYGDITYDSRGYDYSVTYGDMTYDIGRVEGDRWIDGNSIGATSPGFLMKIAASNQNASTFATQVVTMAGKINELNAAVARMAKG